MGKKGIYTASVEGFATTSDLVSFRVKVIAWVSTDQDGADWGRRTAQHLALTNLGAFVRDASRRAASRIPDLIQDYQVERKEYGYTVCVSRILCDKVSDLSNHEES